MLTTNWKPFKGAIPVLDADSLIYRVGFAAENEDESIAISRLRSRLLELFFVEFDCCDGAYYYGYIGGSGNYRSDIAVTKPYKGNRSGVRPKHYDALRSHLVSEWGFKESVNQEAEDCVGIKATELGDKAVIVYYDKDLLNVPGWHYNFVSKKGGMVTVEEARKHFYTQILTGDRIDNIQGVKGIGPVKAAKLLSDCVSEVDYYACCVEAFQGDEERVIENARLLWIRTKPNELWEPPKWLSE